MGRYGALERWVVLSLLRTPSLVGRVFLVKQASKFQIKKKKHNKMLYCLHLPCSKKQVEWVVLYKKVEEKSLLKWFVCRRWLVPSAADTTAGWGGSSQCNHIKSCWSLARDRGGAPARCCTQHRLSLFSSWEWETDKSKTLIFVNGRSESVRLLFLPNNCALAARRKFRSWKFTGHFEVVNTAVLCLWCFGSSLGTRRPKERKWGKK
jgi:hypothetical protein